MNVTKSVLNFLSGSVKCGQFNINHIHRQTAFYIATGLAKLIQELIIGCKEMIKI